MDYLKLIHSSELRLLLFWFIQLITTEMVISLRVAKNLAQNPARQARAGGSHIPQAFCRFAAASSSSSFGYLTGPSAQ